MPQGGADQQVRSRRPGGHCTNFQCPKLAPMPIAAESGQSIGFGTSGVRESRDMRAQFASPPTKSSAQRIGRAFGYGSHHE
jgi:hypothetical protein